MNASLAWHRPTRAEAQGRIYALYVYSGAPCIVEGNSAADSGLQGLSMAGLNGLAIAEIDLDQFFAGRNSCRYFLCGGVDDRTAVGISVFAIHAKRKPARVRLLGRVLKQRHVCDM